MIGRGWGLVLFVSLAVGLSFKINQVEKTVQMEALNSRCMVAIVQSAYRNQMVFAAEGIVLASHVQNCENLRGGFRRLLATGSKLSRSQRV